MHVTKKMKSKETSTSFPVSKTTPKVPISKTVPPEPVEEKNHSSKTEELPHIHHFHKERIKKEERRKKLINIYLCIYLIIKRKQINK